MVDNVFIGNWSDDRKEKMTELKVSIIATASFLAFTLSFWSAHCSNYTLTVLIWFVFILIFIGIVWWIE